MSKPELFDTTVILITFDENESYPDRNQVWSLLTGAIPKQLRGTKDNTFYTRKPHLSLIKSVTNQTDSFIPFIDYSTLSTVEHNWDLGNLGQQDTNKTVSNVFAFAAKALNYKNIHVPENEIPWNNNTITGLLTGKSYNQTHPATTN